MKYGPYKGRGVRKYSLTKKGFFHYKRELQQSFSEPIVMEFNK